MTFTSSFFRACDPDGKLIPATHGKTLQVYWLSSASRRDTDSNLAMSSLFAVTVSLIKEMELNYSVVCMYLCTNADHVCYSSNANNAMHQPAHQASLDSAGHFSINRLTLSRSLYNTLLAFGRRNGCASVLNTHSSRFIMSGRLKMR